MINILKKKTVNGYFKFPGFWHPAHNLTELLTNGETSLKASFPIKTIDVTKGLVNGVKVRCMPTRTYPPEELSTQDLQVPKGYNHWDVNPVKKKVRLLSISSYDQADIDKQAALGQQIASDPRYLPPIERDLPKGWKVIEPFSGFFVDRRQRPKLSVEQASIKLRGFLNGKVNSQIEEVFGWPGKDELVPLVFARSLPKYDKQAKFWEVTGQAFKHSEKILYRLLHYWSPVHITDFYKGQVLRIHHPRGIAFVDFETWKCEMAVRLYAEKSLCLQLKSASCIRAGIPGAQSDEIGFSKEVKQWYQLLLSLVHTKTMIYSGNYFEV